MAAPGVNGERERTFARLAALREKLDTLREVVWGNIMLCQDPVGQQALVWAAQRILDILEEDQAMAKAVEAPVVAGRK